MPATYSTRTRQGLSSPVSPAPTGQSRFGMAMASSSLGSRLSCPGARESSPGRQARYGRTTTVAWGAPVRGGGGARGPAERDVSVALSGSLSCRRLRPCAPTPRPTVRAFIFSLPTIRTLDWGPGPPKFSHGKCRRRRTPQPHQPSNLLFIST